MAYDLGPKIGIDGEAEFRKQIQQISENVKTLGSELKVVASAADLEGDSIESLSSKNEILNKTISELEKKLSAQQDMLQKATKEFGETDTKTQKWQRTVNATETELNKLRSQVSKNEKAMDELEKGTDDASDAMDDLGDAADNSGGKLDSMTVAMGNLISSGIQKVIDGVINLASEIWNLDEATEEYRRAQGRLQTAFEAAGYSGDPAQQAYTEFYKILGDTDTATEASQLLAQLAENEEDVATWTEIAAGVSGTFGDSLPIEGLIEASNETAKVGEVTGVLADALNWVGISEDEFNEKLAACSDESERNQLIMETLAGQYDEASDAFYRNNEALVESRETQAQLDETLSSVGEQIANIKGQLLDALIPALQQLVDTIDWTQVGKTVSNLISFVVQNGPTILSIVTGIGAGFAAWKITSIVSSAVTALTSLVPALTGATAAQTGLNVAMSANPIGAVITIVAALVTAIVTLWNTSEGFRDAVTAVWEAVKGAFLSAWEAIKGAWGAAVDFFQGIWEGIQNTFSAVVDWFSDIFSSAWEAIKNAWSVVVDFFSGIWDGIKNTFSVVADVLGGFFSRAWDAITGVWDGVTDWFSNLWDSIKNVFSNAWETFCDIGENIVNGIWQGIKNIWNNLVSWFNGLWDGLVGGVKSFLGIASPSKVFAGIGENMALGLGEGFDGEMGAVERSINRSMANLLPDVSSSVKVKGATASGTSAASDITGAIANALSGAVVYMDGRKVGQLITRQQNNSIRANGLVPTM